MVTIFFTKISGFSIVNFIKIEETLFLDFQFCPHTKFFSFVVILVYTPDCLVRFVFRLELLIHVTKNLKLAKYKINASELFLQNI
jgi:hypothetical protein